MTKPTLAEILKRRLNRVYRVGRKPKLSMWALLVASTLVRKAIDDRGLSGREACKLILSAGEKYFENCPFETFRPNVLAVAGIPRDKLFDDEPDDKPVVQRFKYELREVRDTFVLLEEIGRCLNPNLAAAIQAFNRHMIENFGIDFLGEN